MLLFFLPLIACFSAIQAKIGALIDSCPIQPLDNDKLSLIMCMPFKDKAWGQGDRIRYGVTLPPGGPPDWSISLLSATFQPVFRASMNRRGASMGYYTEPWGTGKWREQDFYVTRASLPEEGLVWVELRNGYKGVELEFGFNKTGTISRIVPHNVANTATDYKYLQITRPTADSSFTVALFTDQKENYKMVPVTDKLFNLVDRLL